MISVEKLTADRDRLRDALSDLIGAKNRDELEGMEAVIRVSPVPEEDKRVAINAIQALLSLDVAEDVAP